VPESLRLAQKKGRDGRMVKFLLSLSKIAGRQSERLCSWKKHGSKRMNLSDNDLQKEICAETCGS